jgi:polar amino acid transport system ATP-binding protein
MLPPLFGQYINQIKLSVLASIIAVPELLHTINTISSETFRPLELYTALAIIFLGILIPCTWLQSHLESLFSRQLLSRANGSSRRQVTADGGTTPETEISIPQLDTWPVPKPGTYLAVRAVSCAYNGRRVLQKVSFNTMAGFVTAIIGPNGSGKTTILRSISGLVAPNAGDPACTLRMGYLAQEHEPFPHLSVQDNLVLPLMVVRKQSRLEARHIAAQWLESLHLEEYAEAKPTILSGGQRQRLTLARTLCLQPHILLLDEPTSAMDFRWAHIVNKLLRRLTDAGLIVVAISHGVGFVRAVADNVVFLDCGEVVEAGPASILAKPRTPGLKSFLEAA